MKEKAYCKNCKHLRDNLVEYKEHIEKQSKKNLMIYLNFEQWCEIKTFSEDWYNKYEENSNPEIKNKNNDCKDYKEK